jgi:hypothetical protein
MHFIREYAPGDFSEVAIAWLESWNATGIDPDRRPILIDPLCTGRTA